MAESEPVQPPTTEPAPSGAADGGAATKKKPRARKSPGKAKPKRKDLPPYNVVLLDDDHHSYAYVIEMLHRIFAHPRERGMQLAQEVDTRGRVIVLTTHKELAELKRDQIHGFGPDPRVEECAGSMTAVVEPAK